MTRYITDDAETAALRESLNKMWKRPPESTPLTDTMEGGEERFRIYRLCDGNLELVATCGSKEAVGVALVTLSREGEFDKCPIGLMERPAGQETGTWLVRPWLPFPTPKTLSDAGRALRSARTA